MNTNKLYYDVFINNFEQNATSSVVDCFREMEFNLARLNYLMMFLSIALNRTQLPALLIVSVSPMMLLSMA